MKNFDKFLHFIVSFILTVVIALLVKHFNEDTSSVMCGLFAAIVALCVGFGKEVIDKFTGGIFDWKDIIADAVGCAVAFIFTIFM